MRNRQVCSIEGKYPGKPLEIDGYVAQQLRKVCRHNTWIPIINTTQPGSEGHDTHTHTRTGTPPTPLLALPNWLVVVVVVAVGVT